MALLPQVLLSNQSRGICIEKLKSLPALTYTRSKSKVDAAVLVPLCVENDEVHLLYTLRSLKLKKHSGQVSFPGGMMEKDEKVTEAALRETEEEIGHPSNLIDVWCEMPTVQGRDKNMLITPVVGIIKNFDMKKLKPNTHEVEEIFTVSMNSFCNDNNYAHFTFNEMMLPVFVSGKHRIWGITAVITHLFLQNFLPNSIYHPDFTRKQFTMEELLPSKL